MKYIKTIYKGYFSKLLLYKKNKELILIKKFIKNKKSIKYEDISIGEIFEREIKGIKKLGSVKERDILTPNILEINKKELWYSQKFIKLVNFNKYLIKNSNIFFTNKFFFNTIVSFGKYLKKLHEKTNRIHGDLNQNNLGFVNGKLFVYDPSYLKWQYDANPYQDLARVVCNFYPYNLLCTLFISNKKKLISNFLKGYGKVDVKKLKRTIISMLQQYNQLPMKNSKLYKLKFLYIKFWNKLIITLIKKNLILDLK